MGTSTRSKRTGSGPKIAVRHFLDKELVSASISIGTFLSIGALVPKMLATDLILAHFLLPNRRFKL